MDPNDTFEVALASVSAKLLPDETTQFLAADLHRDFREGVRVLAVQDKNAKWRTERLQVLERRLLEGLEKLTDTEPEADVEQNTDGGP